MRRALIAVFAATALVGGSIAVATSALADTSNCRTTVTQLNDRPDGGNHGTWAQDTFTRTVKICEGDAITAPPVLKETTVRPNNLSIGWSKYHATVTDTGTFITNGGANLSPNAGYKLIGGVPGTMFGSFDVDFIAVSNFANFTAAFNGHTYSGTAPSSTPDFVKEDWGGGQVTDFNFGTKNNGFDNKTWTWTYKTCSEQWVDAASNNDGTDDSAGDIVGKDCPSPSPSVSPSRSPSPSPSTSHSPSPTPTQTTTQAPPPGSTTVNLPVTG